MCQKSFLEHAGAIQPLDLDRVGALYIARRTKDAEKTKKKMQLEKAQSFEGRLEKKQEEAKKAREADWFFDDKNHPGDGGGTNSGQLGGPVASSSSTSGSGGELGGERELPIVGEDETFKMVGVDGDESSLMCVQDRCLERHARSGG